MGDLKPPPAGERPGASEETHVVVQGGGRARVTVAGELSDSGATALRARVDDLVARGAMTVVVDLEQCGSIGPAALDTLASATAALRGRGASLIVSGVGPSVVQRLVRDGLAGQLTIGRLPVEAGTL